MFTATLVLTLWDYRWDYYWGLRPKYLPWVMKTLWLKRWKAF